MMPFMDDMARLQPEEIEYFKELLSRQLDELLLRAEKTVAQLVQIGRAHV